MMGHLIIFWTLALRTVLLGRRTIAAVVFAETVVVVVSRLEWL
jgi:uncharacterized membrane protein YcaP (DUF421 family)